MLDRIFILERSKAAVQSTVAWMESLHPAVLESDLFSALGLILYRLNFNFKADYKRVHQFLQENGLNESTAREIVEYQESEDVPLLFASLYKLYFQLSKEADEIRKAHIVKQIPQSRVATPEKVKGKTKAIFDSRKSHMVTVQRATQRKPRYSSYGY